MKKMMSWLENSFSPKMMKVNNNVWVMTIKDSIMQTLPFIFLGSLFCCFAILNDYIPNLPSFWTPFGWTMGKVSILVSFLIPFNLMEKKRLRKQRLIAGMTGLIVFMMVITPQVELDGVIGFGHDALGAGGMFVAIFSGVFVGLIMQLFGKFSFFKKDSAIPDFVKSWFDSMLPIGICIIAGWVVVLIMNIDLYNIILAIFMPLQNFIQTPYGFALIMFVYCFLYSMGISSWVLTPVTEPVMLAAIAKNIELAAAGTATASTLNLVTSTTIYSAYLWVGGIGCTFPLVIMLMRSKLKKHKALGTACFVPSIFNINEPVVFGAIAWNPLLMLPMWIISIVLPLVTVFFTKVIQFAPIPTLQFQMWYCPFPFATWFSTGAVTGLLLMVINVAIATVIWYPFYKAYEKQELKAEEGEIAAKAKKATA